MLTLLCIITAAQQEQQKFQELENSEPRKVYFGGTVASDLSV
jgi:hypothetical protein